MSLTDEVKQMAFENTFKKLTPEEIDNLYKINNIKKISEANILENPFFSMLKDIDETKKPNLNFYTKYLKYKKNI